MVFTAFWISLCNSFRIWGWFGYPVLFKIPHEIIYVRLRCGLCGSHNPFDSAPYETQTSKTQRCIGDVQNHTVVLKWHFNEFVWSEFPCMFMQMYHNAYWNFRFFQWWMFRLQYSEVGVMLCDRVWKWRLEVTLKHWYLSTKLFCVIFKKINLKRCMLLSEKGNIDPFATLHTILVLSDNAKMFHGAHEKYWMTIEEFWKVIYPSKWNYPLLDQNQLSSSSGSDVIFSLNVHDCIIHKHFQSSAFVCVFDFQFL